MMMTEGDGHTLQIGRDIMECLVGKPCSRGEIAVGQTHYKWTATVACTVAERLLRHAAKQDGVRITYFRSQNI